MSVVSTAWCGRRNGDIKMKETEEKDNAAMLEAYRIAADKAEHMARTGAFDLWSVTNWEDHRQEAALAIAKKKGEPKAYLTVTGLRALRYSHAAALREKYAKPPLAQSNAADGSADHDDDAWEDETAPEEPARPNSWAHWRRARFTLEETAPALSWRTIRTLAAFLAEDMDFDAAAARLHVHRATAYRMFRRAASEFRRQCQLR